MNSGHRILKKNFETEIWVNEHKLPLNNFVQETLANMMAGFLKTLKDFEDLPKNIEIKIRRLPEQIEVDAHTYP